MLELLMRKTEPHLYKSDSIKVEIVELESPAWSRRLGSESEANLEVREQEGWQDLRNFQLRRTE